MSSSPLYLQIHAHRFDRFGPRARAEGEILYSFYVDGRLLGKATVDVGTRRSLLGRLYDITAQAAVTGWTPELTLQLTRIGQQLYRIFIPSELQRVFSESELHRIVTLELQDHDIPWELIADQEGFIAKRAAFGRRLPRPADAGVRPTRKHVEIAVVGDPTGDLPDARAEASMVAQRCEQALDIIRNRFAISGDVRVILGSEATKEAVLFDLLMDPARDLDLIHYAGHAKHDPRDPANTSLPLYDGDLRGFEARNLTSSPIVFVNGCRAAAGDIIDTVSFGSISGLAAEFIAGGAKSYIAPLWPVTDAAAKRFAGAFYDRVMLGDTVGEAILSARIDGTTPDALAYVLFGDPSESLGIFHPRLTAGPYVNDSGIHRIIDLEREYSALELLAVNDLPWILWDSVDVTAWVHKIPIDEDRTARSTAALEGYIEDFSAMVRRGDKTLIAVVNESIIRQYLLSRGVHRARELLTVLQSLSECDTFCMLLLDHEDGEIEEIELVSKEISLPPDPRNSVYVFNKQTRFEDGERIYSLYEDYNPDLIRQYIDRYFKIIGRALAAYETRFAAAFDISDFRPINLRTEFVISSMISDMWKSEG